MESGRISYTTIEEIAHCKDNGEVEFVERIVMADGEEVYRDKQRSAIHLKDRSLLKEFIDWANPYMLPDTVKKRDARADIIKNRCNRRCFLGILWFKIFGKRF